MGVVRLTTLRSALDGLWDSTQVAFWVRAAEKAASKGDWTAATHRLLQLNDRIDGPAPLTEPWRELAVAVLELAVRTDDSAEIATAAARVLGRAWTPSSSPDALQSPFRVARCGQSDRGGEALGALLERRFPHWPYGPYAAADFAERAARQAGREVANPDLQARRFERAAALFENRGDPAAVAHCRLRAATLILESTGRTSYGRAALRAVDRNMLGPREQMWLAYGHAHSPFWLDRLRAADFVGDVWEDAEHHVPKFDDAMRRGATAVGRALFHRLPARPVDAEVDRLESVLERFEGRERWAFEAQIRGRVSTSKHADVLIEKTTVSQAEAIEADALPLRGFAALVAAWHDEPSPEGVEVRGVAAQVVTVLGMLRENSPELADGLDVTTRAVRDANEPGQSKPVALVLSRLLESKIEDESLARAATELAVTYIRRGPPPSYGFWALAANLFAAKLDAAGAVAVRRALDVGEPRPERWDEAVARAVQWAVRTQDDAGMVEWLETARELLG